MPPAKPASSSDRKEPTWHASTHPSSRSRSASSRSTASPRSSRAAGGSASARSSSSVTAPGHVGVGLGKAGEVPESIRKGVEDAKKNLIRIPMVGTTIPHEVAGPVRREPGAAQAGLAGHRRHRRRLGSGGPRGRRRPRHPARRSTARPTRSTSPGRPSRPSAALHSAEELSARRGVRLVQPDLRPAGAGRRRWPMAAKLKVTQVKSEISHIARNRATVRALGLHGIGSTSVDPRQPRDPRHGPPGPLPRDRRGDRATASARRDAQEKA